MKKKILICLGIMLTIIPVLCFIFMGSIKKSPVTPETYINTMTKYNIRTQDVTKFLDEETKQFVSIDIEAEGGISVFVKCFDSDKASVAYNSYDRNLSAQVNKFYNVRSFENNNFQYKDFNSEDTYVALIRVNDTVFQGAIGLKDKPVIEQIIKDLGYDLDSKYNIIIAFAVVSIILSALLMFVCFASIFKKHNIHPLLSVVPIANSYYVCKIADKNGWKMLFFLIPVFSFVYYFILAYKLAKLYTNSKPICFGIGFLPLVLLPMIAFDEPIQPTQQKNAYEEILEEYNIK